MDTDAPGDLAIGSNGVLPLRRAAQRVNDALKFNQQSIPGSLDDAAVMLRYFRIHDAAAGSYSRSPVCSTGCGAPWTRPGSCSIATSTRFFRIGLRLVISAK